MSDFDTVLERLLVDDGFRAALAADPGAALHGYRLAPDEVELLRTQAGGDPGGQGAVEARTSKSSLFGLFGAFTEAAGGSGGGGAGQFGAGGGHGSLSAAGSGGGHGSLSAAGSGGQESLGAAPPSDHVQFGEAPSRPGHETLGVGNHQTFGEAGQGTPGHAPGDHQPAHYHPRIDADGDGRADQYTTVQHRDGSVDIYVDRNHDGKVDFIGHDRNHDGRVETADYDEDYNGTYETHMRDVNGDGWLDTRSVTPDRQNATGAETIGQNMSEADEAFGGA